MLQEEKTFQQQFVPQFIPQEAEPQRREREGEEPSQAQVTQPRKEVTLALTCTCHAKTWRHTFVRFIYEYFRLHYQNVFFAVGTKWSGSGRDEWWPHHLQAISNFWLEALSGVCITNQYVECHYRLFLFKMAVRLLEVYLSVNKHIISYLCLMSSDGATWNLRSELVCCARRVSQWALTICLTARILMKGRHAETAGRVQQQSNPLLLSPGSGSRSFTH